MSQSKARFDVSMWMFGAVEVRRQLDEAKERAIQSTANAVELNTRTLYIRIEQRLHPPQKLNIQDHEVGTRRSKSKAVRQAIFSSYSATALRGMVAINGHPMSVRSRAASAVVERVLGESALKREGLWLQASRRRPNSVIPTHNKAGRLRPWAQNRTSRSGLSFFAFAEHPKLGQWAERDDRGRQHLRHTLVVEDGKVLLDLIAAPVLERSRSEFERNLAIAFEREMSRLA